MGLNIFAKKSPLVVETEESAINDFLTRGVETVLPSADEARELLQSGKRLRIYTGVDATGKFLHLGHALIFRKLAKLHEMGHEIIVLIGNFTGKIGDPTDKMSARTQLTDEQIEENMQGYIQQLKPIFNFNDKHNPIRVVYNADWLSALSFADVVELASKFTVQQMLERDMFDRRIKEGKPIHLHEFLYPLMQGYDSVYLDVDMEIGGNDQTFNMLAGRTLQKAYGKRNKLVMTMALLTDAQGNKMSKSENNYVALTDDAREMFGKVMSWTDDVIVNAFTLLTDVSLEDIEKIREGLAQGANPRDYKLDLAYHVVRIYKGEAEANVARDNFIQVFSQGNKPVDIEEKFASTRNIVDALVEVGMVSSKGEAKRVIEQKGLKVNDVVVSDVGYELSPGVSLVQKGKRHFINISVE